MRQPLINFIDRLLGPDDFVALMTPEMSATEITLGRKTTVITNSCEREWLWGRRGRLGRGRQRRDRGSLRLVLSTQSVSTENIAAQMKARRREKLTLDALEDLMVHLGGIREERKAVITVTEGWRIYRPDSQLARPLGDRQLGPGDVLLRPPRPSPSDTSQLQGSPRVKCEADRMALAMLDHEFRLQELTRDRQSRQRDVLSRVRSRPRGVRCADRAREAAADCTWMRRTSARGRIRCVFWPTTPTARPSSTPTTSTARCAASWTTCRRTT